MIYEFEMADQNNELSKLYYNTYTSALLDELGESVVPLNPPKEWNTAIPVSPTEPGKKGYINTLKIQLGLKCNYSCVYCSQALQIEHGVDTNVDDAKDFLDNLDNWLPNIPKKIEFWGGEPFVYWSKIKLLLPALREKFPNASFLIITNGSLLNDEKIEYIKKYDIAVGISHDGPAQKFRGPDPLKDQNQFAMIKKLFDARPGKVSFNIVLHAKNRNLSDIYEWFNEKFPNPNLTIEGVVNVYDNYTLSALGNFTKDEYLEFSNNIFEELYFHGNRFNSLHRKFQDFTESLKDRRPISALYQKCGMDRPDQIAVDLSGNVMTCQNTGAKGEHNIGHVNDYDSIRLTTSTHLSNREECMGCPLVQLCKGSCMYLNGDYFARSCWNEYYYNLGVLRAALLVLTGKVLVGINGEIVRPEFSQEQIKKTPKIMELYE